MNQCKICSKDIDPNSPHFVLHFNKVTTEDGEKKVLESQEGAIICEECGGEGMPYVLTHLKMIHDSDTELEKKINDVLKAVDMKKLMKDYDLTLDKFGVDDEYLAQCPFHHQDSSFLIDATKKKYFCFCEGLEGDAISFVVNYDRDVNHKHTTLKQAVDFLMEKFPVD